MSSPIENQRRSEDFEKFVLQQVPNVNMINYNVKPQKPFELNPSEKTKKSKKDLEKKKKEEEKKNLKRPFDL